MGGKWRRASRQWRAVAGRLTAPKELVSCIWQRAPQIIWGGCQTYLEPNARALPPLLFLCFLCLSLSLSLVCTLRTAPEQGLLFLCFSLPFSPYFSSARVTFSLNTERAGRSKDAGATAANDMRPAAAEQLGNSRTQDLGLPRNEPLQKVPPQLPSRDTSRTIKWRYRKYRRCLSTVVTTFSVLFIDTLEANSQ